MDNLEIEYFLEVSNRLSYTKAAEALYVSQSTISKKIKALEDELGFLLFNRNSKYVELTENGKSLKKYFEKALKEFNKELSIAKMRSNRESKIIRIGLIEGWNINQYISKLHQCSFSDHRIEFDKINNLLKKLGRREFDVIIGSKKGILQALGEEKMNNVVIKDLNKIKRIIYLSKNNPLSNKKDLSIKDLNGETFYIGKSMVARQNAQNIIDNENIKVKYAPRLNRDTIALELSLGDGFALGDDYSKEKSDNDFRYFYIDYYQEVSLCYIEDNLDLKKIEYIKEIEEIFKPDNSKME